MEALDQATARQLVAAEKTEPEQGKPQEVVRLRRRNVDYRVALGLSPAQLAAIANKTQKGVVAGKFRHASIVRTRALTGAVRGR